jgi:5-enolpyruvylshikimate-3-phosphate synthase
MNLILIPEGTLVDRVKKFCDDPNMVNWSLEKLLNTKDRTTQWASAAILCGSTERIENPEPKIRASYDAVDHYRRMKGGHWKKQHDMTIMAQALAYLNMVEGKTVNYVPQDAEDYCFSRAFRFMTKEEGEAKYPSLRGHESDRIIEMEKQLSNLNRRISVDSNDHRVVQAISMMYVTKRKAHIKRAMELGMTSEEAIRRIQSKFSNPQCVSKSWPQFWKFMKYSIELL